MNPTTTALPAVPPSVAVLEPFVERGVFDAAEVQLAASLARLAPGLDPRVLLAAAVAARAPRLGHVGVRLDQVAQQLVARDHLADDLPWPDPQRWQEALEASDAVSSDPVADVVRRPLVWDGGRLYLRRLWFDEALVADRLRTLATAPTSVVGGDEAALDQILDRLFPRPPAPAPASTGSRETRRQGAALHGSEPKPAEPPALDLQSLDLQSIGAAEDLGGQLALFGASDPVQPDPTDSAATPVAAASVAPSGAAPAGPATPAPEEDRQRRAAHRALTSRVSLIAGGPGTGKTRTIARTLAAALLRVEAAGERLDVALAAPTGKAAARMKEAVASAVADLADEGLLSEAVAARLVALEPVTLHALLGARPGAPPRFGRHAPLPFHLLVVDEMSMVSLPLMARLLDAVRHDARLVLVGDPFQLASVEAGTVLADLVGPTVAEERAPAPAGGVTGTTEADPGATGDPLAARTTVLTRVHRFGARSGIAEVSDAIRRGDVDRTLAVLTGAEHPDVTWIRPGAVEVDALVASVVGDAVGVVEAAQRGEAAPAVAAAHRTKVLTAVRRGHNGLYDWSDRIEAALASRLGRPAVADRWYLGRAVLVTANDPLHRLANGDVGVVVAHGERGRRVAVAGEPLRLLPITSLAEVETWWAMTIHKSQGSEFPHVVVALPDASSPVLTRELLYTAVTRARQQLTIVADPSALATAVDRQVARASGLRDRLDGTRW